MSFQFQVKVEIALKKDKDIDGYVVHCPAFDVTSQGDTQKEAIENIKEAVSLFVISCYERGTLPEVLKDCGFQRAHKRSSNSRNIQVPLPFEMAC